MLSKRKKPNGKHHTKAVYTAIVILVVILIWAVYSYMVPVVTVPTATTSVSITSPVSLSTSAYSSVTGLILVASDFNATSNSVCIQTHTMTNQVDAEYAIHIFNRLNAAVHYDSVYASFAFVLSNGTNSHYEGSIAAKFPIYDKDMVTVITLPISGKGFEHGQVVGIRATITLSVEEVKGPFAMSFNLPPPNGSSC